MLVGDRRIEVTNRGKVFFEADGITKGDVVDYYLRSADLVLGWLADRPLVMQHYPDGIASHGFYQKDAPDHFPSWIRRIELPKEGGTVRYVVADEPAASRLTAPRRRKERSMPPSS